MKTLLLKLDQLMAVLSCLLGAAIVFVAFMQVFSRYILGHAFTWPEELCGFMFMWCSLFGMVLATSHDAHLRVDAFVSMFSPQIQRRFHQFAYIALFLFSLYMVYLGYELTYEIYDMEQYATALPIPIWAVVAVMPVAFFLNAVFALLKCCLSFTESFTEWC